MGLLGVSAQNSLKALSLGGDTVDGIGCSGSLCFAPSGSDTMGLESIVRKGNESENEKESETDRNVNEEDVNLQKDGSKESIDCSEKRKEKKLKKKKKEKNKESELVEGQNGEEQRPSKSEKEKRKKKGSDDVAKNVEMESEIGDKIAKPDRERKSENGSDVVEFGKRIDKKCDGDKKKKGTESGDVSSSADVEVGKSKKKRKKKTRGENVSNIKELDNVDISELESDVGGDKSTKEKKQKKKQKKKNENGFAIGENDVGDKKRKESKSEDVCSVADEEGVKRIKKKKITRNENVYNGTEGHVDSDEERDTDKKKKKKKSPSEDVSDGVESEAKSNEAGGGKKKEKKRKRTENRHVSDGAEGEKNNDDQSDKSMKKKAKTGKGEKEKAISKNDLSEGPKPKKKSKRVSFSDDIEVFEDGPSKERSWKMTDEEGLVQGKRFTGEEDDMVKTAVLSYIEEHNLGENGLDMVLNCKKHPEVRNCWKLIAQALPQRPLASIYYRAHILFERSELRKWTDEEREFVREFHKKHGSNWKAMAVELKKHRFHCKDLWRRIKRTGLNKGRWKQEEYQNLFDLVNMDLRMRALEERKSKHGMLRDNICWEAIGDRLVTRGFVNCCVKWYSQLTSPMVAEGLWADTDDYRLIDALVSVDAPSLEEVDWDSLLEHREGSLALKRWNQMVKHIGDYSKLSFSEQVEVLEKRYNPDCIEAREEFDSKPFSDVDLVGGDDDSSE